MNNGQTYNVAFIVTGTDKTGSVGEMWQGWTRRRLGIYFAHTPASTSRFGSSVAERGIANPEVVGSNPTRNLVSEFHFSFCLFVFFYFARISIMPL